MTFSDMVMKQRTKNNGLSKAIDKDWMLQRCEGVKRDYEAKKQEILNILSEFVDEAESETGTNSINYVQSYEFVDLDEIVDAKIEEVKDLLGL